VFIVEIEKLIGIGSVLPLIILLLLILLAAFIDLRSNRIPNILTFPGMLAALFYFSAANGLDGFFFSLKGIGLGIGLLLIPYMMGGMGAGDAKFMGVVGGFLGAKGVLAAFLFTAIIGGVHALFILFVYRKKFAGHLKDLLNRWSFFISTKTYLLEPEDNQSRRPRLCYGLTIALGTASYMSLSAFGYHIF
jgi:prepilin peptidase CpaA